MGYPNCRDVTIFKAVYVLRVPYESVDLFLKVGVIGILKIYILLQKSLEYCKKTVWVFFLIGLSVYLNS